jgi:nucleotide-binding universal stress UspA family protein
MMKTILVTIDFSAPLQTASHFAMYLANKMKVRVALCHVIQMSPAIAVAAQVSGGLESFGYQGCSG